MYQLGYLIRNAFLFASGHKFMNEACRFKKKILFLFLQSCACTCLSLKIKLVFIVSSIQFNYNSLFSVSFTIFSDKSLGRGGLLAKPWHFLMYVELRKVFTGNKMGADRLLPPPPPGATCLWCYALSGVFPWPQFELVH